ncbi:glycoside hydrolase family 16 protein [Xanthomonas citri pv. fuscans]|nr:glycoside hydrolase family 16 protein [Xanthomonas citri]UZB00884.1 glycoside hydrolase family 16 protein [Xanthomonas citri pv. fuscans]UZB06055.1 glycoside hydrolase family 16 protein [Xanthomonas citri pv. fuscans]UZB09327.1 glycoside hydrolase family 16 protein [Xanthomonas citri pv. fuscans]
MIEARREAFGGMPFTSARLKTEGRMHFTYGTLEARIKTPVVGNGLWPAYWMLGTIGVWPGRGEIDLMEAGMAAAIANGTATAASARRCTGTTTGRRPITTPATPAR